MFIGQTEYSVCTLDSILDDSLDSGDEPAVENCRSEDETFIGRTDYSLCIFDPRTW